MELQIILIGFDFRCTSLAYRKIAAKQIDLIDIWPSNQSIKIDQKLYLIAYEWIVYKLFNLLKKKKKKRMQIWDLVSNWLCYDYLRDK